MNKAKFIISFLFLGLLLSACKEDGNGDPQAKPSSSLEEPEIEVSFPNITKNLVSEGTLTIINKSKTEAITNIAIEGLPTKVVTVKIKNMDVNTSIFNYLGAKPEDTDGVYPGGIVGVTSCAANRTLKKDFCEIKLRAEKNNQLGVRLEKIKVSFTFKGKKITREVQLSSTIVDRKELFAGHPIFITNNGLHQEASLKYPFSLTNLSNIHEVTNIKIKPAPNSVFTLRVNKISSIKPKSLVDWDQNKGEKLNLSYKPTVAGPPVTETWDIEYDIGTGADKEHRITQFNVSAVATTAPGALEITGYDFGSRTLIDGDTTVVRLNLDNPSAAKQGKNIADLKLSPESKTWDAELSVDKKSTCIVNPDLAAGMGCYYDIQIAPHNSDAKYARKLVLALDNKKTEIKFDINGNITVLPVGTVLEQTVFPEVIKAESKLSDPYFPYIKRPTVANATMSYSADILKRIPQDTRQHGGRPSYFVPWTFYNAWRDFRGNLGDKTELGMIVPDRVKDKTGKDYKDPITGKNYIKLYHGSAAKYKSAFLKDGIAFNKGVRNAYGQGFYLTADINEAKRYACDAASLAGGSAIVLVVGVEDRHEIVGRKSGTYQSNISTGEPYDKSIYFGVGHDNQFVFFSNALKYMKFFTLVDLPPKFGAAAGIIESNDGYSTVETQVDHDPNGQFRCNN
jgi:hypothetical protein